MNDEHKEKIYYIEQQADELCAEISKLMRKDADDHGFIAGNI